MSLAQAKGQMELDLGRSPPGRFLNFSSVPDGRYHADIFRDHVFEIRAVMDGGQRQWCATVRPMGRQPAICQSFDRLSQAQDFLQSEASKLGGKA